MYKSISFNPHERANVFFPYVFSHDAFTADDCKRIIEQCKSDDLVAAQVDMSKETFGVNASVRRSNVKFYGLNDQTAWIFNKLSELVSGINEHFYNFNLNGFTAFQFTEYKEQDEGTYDWHCDTFFARPDKENIGIRKLSVTLQLNDGFEGGEFYVCEGDQRKAVPIQTKLGTALLFPSFMPHKVAPVTKGCRYSLVVWVYGPKFI